jgi:hypothetical protein
MGMVNVITLTVVILNVVMLYEIMMSGVMLNAVMLNVVAPFLMQHWLLLMTLDKTIIGAETFRQHDIYSNT